MKEKSKWEEIIRSKLKDFEVDTMPDDWKAIESRLSDKKVVLFRRWYYVAAAITLFLLITGGYFYFKAPSNSPEGEGYLPDVELVAGIQDIDEVPMIVEIGEIEEVVETRDAVTSYELRVTNYETRQAVETGNLLETITVQTSTNILTELLPSSKTQLVVKQNYITQETIILLKQLFGNYTKSIQTNDIQYIADATSLETNKKSGKRWTVGAGGGSYSVGTNGGGFVNIGRSDDALYAMRALNNGAWYMESPVRRYDHFNDYLHSASNSVLAYNETSVEKVDVSHRQPISLGIGVGYTLNNRWSLQSGLVYTILSSEWRTAYEQDKHKQQLHFVGVPLGISYKIAEWNKLRFYASAGGMIEWNAGGNIKTKYYYYEDEAYRTVKEFVRMKEMQWSVNARVGATYPLIRFVNAYMEGGANYYFNNNSLIETIRSDKPFHVSLQAGLRFGF